MDLPQASASGSLALQDDGTILIRVAHTGEVAGRGPLTLPGTGALQPRAAPSAPLDWCSLPQGVLATILHPSIVGKAVREVSKDFRHAYDAGVQCATLYVPSTFSLKAGLPHALAHLPRVKVVASVHKRALRDDLFAALKSWRVSSPLRLELCGEAEFDAEAAKALAGVLCHDGFAPGGLQALNLRRTYERIGALASHLATAVRHCTQLAGLHELRLTACRLQDKCFGKLCAALQAATHMRSLAVLDLSDNYRLAIGPLAACLRGARHMSSSLRELYLADVGMDAEGARHLSDAVVQSGVQLRVLDLKHNKFGDKGAAAWAAALAAPSLSSLEVLNMRYCDFGDEGLAWLVDALGAAKHLTRVRRLLLRQAHVSDEGVRYVRLLETAPHLAASLNALEHPYQMSADALACVGGVLLAPAHMPQLRILDLHGIKVCKEGVNALCSGLRAATHLTGLRELDLPKLDDELSAQIDVALAECTHLSGLQRLSAGDVIIGRAVMSPRLLRLLEAAPHLRGLTDLTCMLCGGGGVYSLRDEERELYDALELLPRLRSLKLLGAFARGYVPQLVAALQHAACASGLEELALHDCWPDKVFEPELIHLASSLAACTHVSSLRALTLGCNCGTAIEAIADGVGAALGGARHLSSLRQLCVIYDFESHESYGDEEEEEEDEDEEPVNEAHVRQALERQVHSGHLAGVHVQVRGERLANLSDICINPGWKHY